MSLSTSLIEKKQRNVLEGLIAEARATRFGQKHHFEEIRSYAQFVDHVSVQTYADLRPSVNALKNGKENELWPGLVQNFAVSSGTSGEGKHLPLSDDRLKSDKRFSRKVALNYLRQRPNIFKLIGSHLSMPGSVEQHGEIQIGEISGFTALNAPSWLRIFQVVEPDKLTRLSFRKKFDLLVDKAIEVDLKMITAVPSWILTLFQQVLERTDSNSIADVWPNLQLLVCGGVKLANYRAHLEELANGLSLDFIETYGASEGYIGFTDDLRKNDLKMVIDNGIFFECIPDPRPNTNASSIQETVPLWQAETNIPYGLLLTTNAGLWRYTLNDIVQFTSVAPLRFIVKGRLNDMLDDFGEALYIYEAEQALKDAVKKLELKIGTFAISPVLLTENEIPYHRWFVQFIKPVSFRELKETAHVIDKQLQKKNRHYFIRRESNALAEPKIRAITQDDINQWMQAKGKAKAQAKLPRILDKNIDSLA